MANKQHLRILAKGVESWNEWRKQNAKIKPDLNGGKFTALDLQWIDLHKANLKNANLENANLSSADLRGANLSGADLTGARLSEADLQRVNLSKADLNHTNLSGAILVSARLRSTDLHAADLSHADLFNADLTGANLYRTSLLGASLHQAVIDDVDVGHTLFVDTELTKVHGLENLRHLGPSTISMNTIYATDVNLPEMFLRGCGLSDLQIEQTKLGNPNLTNREINRIGNKIIELRGNQSPLQFHSCFISYSSNDGEFSEMLYSKLQENGVRCWFAPEHMKIGEKIRPRIDESIRKYDKLLLILSEHSVQSEWVEQEVETAMSKERQEKRTVLFPIRLDNAIMEIDTGWPANIRNSRHIGDFTAWQKSKSYRKAFERLLRDLKT